ncbi:MAG: transcription antitermination factor NusB [Bacteroidales bacterium]|jgi:N utilization substance protein B
MITRHQLRIKCLQAVYAFFQNPTVKLPAAEKNFLKNINEIYDLYIYILSALIEVKRWKEKKNEENKQKLLPTAEDLNPNLNFVNNRLIHQFENNQDLKSKISALSINWAEEQPLFRSLYNGLQETEAFEQYMNNETNTYNQDKALVRNELLNVLSNSEWLKSVLAEINISWEEDFDIAIMMTDLTIKQWSKNKSELQPLPPLFKDANKTEKSEDLEFAIQLFRNSILHNQEFEEIIKNNLINWEIERIALIDMIIIKMALAELLHIDSVPIKVTLNEAIEIAKEYGTDNSKQFINGILDKIIGELLKEGKINKTGRGLIN